MRRARLGIFLLLPTLAACGAVREKVEETVLSAEEKWKSQAMDQRREMCAGAQGTFADVDVSDCVNGVAVLEAPNVRQEQACTGGKQTHFEGQCLQHDANGLVYFSDGPSVPYQFMDFGENLGEGTSLWEWNEFFWAAGINHDYCYHNGAATYHYTQQDCDGQMLDDLVALCSQKDNSKFPWFSRDRCTTNAQIMYAAVRVAGGTNFERMATQVPYPDYVPLWQKIGLSAAPDDPALRDAIDKVM